MPIPTYHDLTGHDIDTCANVPNGWFWTTYHREGDIWTLTTDVDWDVGYAIRLIPGASDSPWRSEKTRVIPLWWLAVIGLAARKPPADVLLGRSWLTWFSNLPDAQREGLKGAYELGGWPSAITLAQHLHRPQELPWPARKCY